MTGSEYAAKKKRERNRAYYEQHREEILARNRAYKDANRERIREYNREYQAEYRNGIRRRGEDTEEK